jgi:hypothetical protein
MTDNPEDDKKPEIDPSIPLPTHHQTLEEQAAWFMHLGMFVQAFEDVVQATRVSCLYLTTAEQQVGHFNLMDIVFNHQNLTLLPLFELLRSIIAESLRQNPDLMPEEEKKLLAQIMKDVSEDIRGLNTNRNNILHAHWGIGVPHSAQDPNTRIIMLKKQPGKKGLSFLYPVKTLSDFAVHIGRCKRLEVVILYLFVCVKYQKHKPSEVFRKLGDGWSAYRSDLVKDDS